jgi:hypothetical protein
MRLRLAPRHPAPIVDVPAGCVRRFVLVRHVDPSGVSGTGVVAEGVEFTDGSVVLRWRSDTPSTVVYANTAAVEQVHGHGGATDIEWIDRPRYPGVLGVTP